MVGTFRIHGSKGEVLAPIGNGEFLQAKRQDIITAVSDDEDLPLHVRQEMVGLRISTIFSAKQLKGFAPPESRIAYADEVAEALRVAKKGSIAKQLLEAVRKHDPESEYPLLIFKEGEYSLSR
jgi:hypothetical protein